MRDSEDDGRGLLAPLTGMSDGNDGRVAPPPARPPSAPRQSSTASSVRASYTACDTAKRSATRVLDAGLEAVFGAIGRGVARRPKVAIALSVLATACCALGLLRFSIESDDDVLYLPKHSTAVEQGEWAASVYFEPDSEHTKSISLYCISARHSTRNVLKDTRGLEALFDLTAKILAAKDVGAVYGKDNGLGHQLVQSPIAFWNASKAAFLADDAWRETLHRRPATPWGMSTVDTDADGHERTVPDRIKLDQILGDAKVVADDDGTKSVASAKAIQSKFWFTGDVSDSYLRAMDHVVERESPVNGELHCYLHSHTSYRDAVLAAIQHDMTLVAVSIVLLAVFASLCFRFPRDPLNKFRGWRLGPAAMVSVVLSLVCTFGLWFAGGGYFHSLMGAAIFTVLGLGVDDAFVIVSEVDRIFRATESLPLSASDDADAVAHIVGAGLRRAGASILVTSVTDAAAFAACAVTTSIPALRSFCAVAALAVGLDFVFQVTFFVGILALETAKRLDLVRRDRVERVLVDAGAFGDAFDDDDDDEAASDVGFEPPSPQMRLFPSGVGGTGGTGGTGGDDDDAYLVLPGGDTPSGRTRRAFVSSNINAVRSSSDAVELPEMREKHTTKTPLVKKALFFNFRRSDEHQVSMMMMRSSASSSPPPSSSSSSLDDTAESGGGRRRRTKRRRTLTARVASVIVSPACRGASLVAAALLVAGGIVGVTRLEMDYESSWMAPRGAMVRKAIHVEKKYFVKSNHWLVDVYSRRRASAVLLDNLGAYRRAVASLRSLSWHRSDQVWLESFDDFVNESHASYDDDVDAFDRLTTEFAVERRLHSDELVFRAGPDGECSTATLPAAVAEAAAAAPDGLTDGLVGAYEAYSSASLGVAAATNRTASNETTRPAADDDDDDDAAVARDADDPAQVPPPAVVVSGVSVCATTVRLEWSKVERKAAQIERLDAAQRKLDKIHGARTLGMFVLRSPTLEALSLTRGATTKSVALVAVVVFLCCFALLGFRLWAAALMLVVVAAIDVVLVGSLWYIGEYCNMVTMVILTLAVGLSVDFSAHVTHAFLHSADRDATTPSSASSASSSSSQGRSVFVAVDAMLAPLLKGGTSTLLAVLPMAFSDSYVIRLFCEICLLIISVGLFFGLFVVPALLQGVVVPWLASSPSGRWRLRRGADDTDSVLSGGRSHHQQQQHRQQETQLYELFPTRRPDDDDDHQRYAPPPLEITGSQSRTSLV